MLSIQPGHSDSHAKLRSQVKFAVLTSVHRNQLKMKRQLSFFANATSPFFPFRMTFGPVRLRIGLIRGVVVVMNDPKIISTHSFDCNKVKIFCNFFYNFLADFYDIFLQTSK